MDLAFGDYVLKRSSRKLYYNEELIVLPPKAFDLLCFFGENAGRPLLKAEILAAVWPDTFVEESNLNQTVFLLRKAFGPAGEGLIVTLPRRGYQFTSKVTESAEIPIETDAIVSAGETFLVEPAPPCLVPVSPNTQAAEETLATYVYHEETEILGDYLVSKAMLVGSVAIILAFAAVIVWYFHEPGKLQVVSTVRLTNDGIAKNFGSYHSPLVSDGALLHFIEGQNNRTMLATVPVEGGQVQRQAAPYPDTILGNYSALRHTLLLTSNSHAENLPILGNSTAGGDFQKIGELGGQEASWSPDGQVIAYIRGRSLYTARADGTGSRRLANPGGRLIWPRWSPDGRLISFTENREDNSLLLWQITPEGSKLKRMLLGIPDADHVGFGDWSPDGKNFFFIGSNSPRGSIWCIPWPQSRFSWRRSKPVQLTSGQDDRWQGPLPTPDGQALWSIGARLRAQLTRIDPVSRKAVPFLEGISGEGLAFSHDRAWIAYSEVPSGTLWRSRADGSERRRLTDETLVARYPAWSPDGRTIAFMGKRPNETNRIFLIAVDGTGLRPMRKEEASEGVPNWSPEGDRISFGRINLFGEAKDPNLTIEIVNLRTMQQTTVPGSSGLWTARWSPDGRYLSAVTQDNRTLRLYDTQTGKWTDLTSVGVNDVVWSPDSGALFFDADLGGEPLIYRFVLSSRKLERWADLRGIPRAGPDSPWVGITPDGDILLSRDTSIEEIYRLNLSTASIFQR